MNEISMFDALAAAFWLPSTALLAVSAWRATRRLFPCDDALTRILHTLVACWAVVLVAVFALSALRLLDAHLLLAAVAVSSCVFLADDIRRAGDAPGPRGLAASGAATNTSTTGSWRLAWLAYASLAIVAIVPCGLLQLPTDWDSRAYHIPFIDIWLRACTLNSTDSSSWFHPGNNEVIGLWCVAPFSGDFLVGLNNLPAVAALALGARELARQLGCRGSVAELAGLVAVSPHVVTRQLLDSENDVAVAGLFVTALAYGVRFAGAPSAGSGLLWALSCGILPGVKYYALGYAATACLVVTAPIIRIKGLRAAAGALASAIAGMATLSGYWYVRNWLLTGTPIYPQGFLGTPGLLAETFPHIRQTTLLGHHDASDVPLLVRSIWQSLGPAHCAAFLAAPLTMGPLLVRGVRRRARRRDVMSAALCIAGVLSVAIFISTPFVVESQPGTRDMLKEGYLPGRFFLSGATVMVLALLVCADAVAKTRWRRSSGDVAKRETRFTRRAFRGTVSGIAYGIFAAVAVSQLAPRRFSPLNMDALTLVLAAANVFLAVLIISQVCSGRLGKSVLLATLFFGFVAAASWLGDRWHQRFAQDYDRRYRTQLFEKLGAGYRPDTRVCALMYCSYPFFGSRRQFAVMGPVWVESYEALRHYLLRQRPDLVVVSKGEPSGSRHYTDMPAWLAEHGDLFKLVYSDERFSLYQFVKPDHGELERKRTVAHYDRAPLASDAVTRQRR